MEIEEYRFILEEWASRFGSRELAISVPHVEVVSCDFLNEIFSGLALKKADGKFLSEEVAHEATPICPLVTIGQATSKVVYPFDPVKFEEKFDEKFYTCIASNYISVIKPILFGSFSMMAALRLGRSGEYLNFVMYCMALDPDLDHLTPDQNELWRLATLFWDAGAYIAGWRGEFPEGYPVVFYGDANP